MSSNPGRRRGNDDGLAFASADGAEFSVFASYNALDFDLAGFQDFIVKNLGADAVITYRAHGDDWFVISGTKGSDRIFYERHLLSHGKEMTEGFVASYPAGLKQKYDPIVARMSKSFRAGTRVSDAGEALGPGLAPRVCSLCRKGRAHRQCACCAVAGQEDVPSRDAAEGISRSNKPKPVSSYQRTSTLLNCQGSSRSTSSGNNPPRPSAGVQSV